jgi:hypothetical protein
VTSVDFRDDEWERLMEAARLATLGRLVRSFVHGLSTPLAAIALRAESLERLMAAGETASTAAGADKASRYLRAMADECQRCRDLLATVREFAGRPETATSAVDLAALCRSVARLVADEAMRRQVEVEVAVVSPTLPPLPAQRHLLGHAVLSLVLNAIDANPPGGKVRIEVRGGVDETSVAVEDEGSGVAESVRERLFAPFASSRPPADGQGLGLAACRAIAERHGGSIESSPRPGRGSRFVLRLPHGRAAGPSLGR